MKSELLFLSLLIFFHLFDSQHYNAQTIHDAAKNGDLNIIIKLFEERDTLLSSQDEVGYTPLHWALIRAKWDCADYLLNKGAEVNIAGSEGGTPLHCAANHDNIEFVRRLVEKGALLESKNAWGNTPLSLAAQRGCSKTVEELVRNGAVVNTISNEGWTPLHYAYKSGHKETQKILIGLGASEAALDSFGKVPSDYSFTRPAVAEVNKDRCSEYAGVYAQGNGNFFVVYYKNEKLWLEDFAIDEIYPIAFDTFYDKQEPWKVKFYRNSLGEVNRIAVAFQRQTVVGKKVSGKSEIPQKPRFGVGLGSVNKDNLTSEDVYTLFFDLQLNANVPQITVVVPESPAAKAGIQVYDIVFEYNSVKLNEPGDLQLLTFDTMPGASVNLRLYRSGKVIETTIQF